MGMMQVEGRRGVEYETQQVAFCELAARSTSIRAMPQVCNIRLACRRPNFQVCLILLCAVTMPGCFFMTEGVWMWAGELRPQSKPLSIVSDNEGSLWAVINFKKVPGYTDGVHAVKLTYPDESDVVKDIGKYGPIQSKRVSPIEHASPEVVKKWRTERRNMVYGHGYFEGYDDFRESLRRSRAQYAIWFEHPKGMAWEPDRPTTEKAVAHCFVKTPVPQDVAVIRNYRHDELDSWEARHGGLPYPWKNIADVGLDNGRPNRCRSVLAFTASPVTVALDIVLFPVYLIEMPHMFDGLDFGYH